MNTATAQNSAQGVVLVLQAVYEPGGQYSSAEVIHHEINQATAEVLAQQLQECVHVLHGTESVKVSWGAVEEGDRIESMGGAVVMSTHPIHNPRAIGVWFDNDVRLEAPREIDVWVVRSIR